MEPSVVRQPRLGGSNSFSAAKLSRTGGSAQILELVPAIGTVRTRPRLGLPGTLTQRMDCAQHPGQKTIGLSDAREGARFFYQQTALVNSQQHSVERYLALASLAGASIPENPQFGLPAGRAIPEFELPDRFVVLHPFARGANKSLSSSEIYELTRALAPLAVIVVGRTETDFRFALNAASLVNQTDL